MTALLLELSEVTRHFGGLRAVEGVSLSLARGEVLAIIGPNGAGKTTLFNLISGKLRVTSGSVLLESLDITRKAVRERVQMGIAATFQIPRTLGGLTVREVLHAALGFGRGVREVESPTNQLCARFELDPDAVCAMLDLHRLKRLEMCRAVAVGAKVLMLDEVAAGLDRQEREQIASSIAELAATGIGVVVVEHTMDFIRGLCTRAVVMDFGRVLAAGTVEEVLADERVVTAYLGRPSGPA